MHSRLPMIERPDPWIEALVDVAFAQIIYDDGTVSRSALAIRDYMTWLANRSYEKGRETARLEVMTSDEAALLLGVDRSTIWRRAQRKGVGWMVGRDLLLWPEDLEKLRLA